MAYGSYVKKRHGAVVESCVRSFFVGKSEVDVGISLDVKSEVDVG